MNGELAVLKPGILFRKYRSVAAACLLSLLAAGASAQRVELHNGDTLTGEIVRQSDTHLTIKHGVIGEITIEKKQIKQIITANATPADTQAQTPAAKPPADPAAVKNKAKQQAAKGDAKSNALLSGWKSKLTLGINGASGNTDRQNYIAGFKSRYEDGRDRWLINSRWFYAFSDGEQTQNNLSADLTRDWLQKDSPWFFFLKASYRYDAMRSWEHRTSGFGGGGYTIAKTDDFELNTRLGFGGTYEHGDINEFTPEALFGGSVMNWDITERATLSGETTYFPSLDESGEFRVENSLEWRYKLDLMRGLSLKIGIENEYDSRTTNDNENNELLYFGALVFDF